MNRGGAVVALALAAALAGPAATAGASPLFEGAVGVTGAITGDIAEGGASVAGAVMWPVPEVWKLPKVSARAGRMRSASTLARVS